MDKPEHLRQTLETAISDLKKHPDNLVMFVEDGSIHCADGETLSFKYVYDLTMIVLNYADHPDHFFIPLLKWIQQHQQDLLSADGTPAFTFEAEAIKHGVTDIGINLKLTEPVIVTSDQDGNYTATHVQCPQIKNEDGPTPWTLTANGVDYEPESEPAE